MLLMVGIEGISDNNITSFSLIPITLQNNELKPIALSFRVAKELLTEKYPSFPFPKVNLTQVWNFNL